jgi:hypothetical protein
VLFKKAIGHAPRHYRYLALRRKQEVLQQPRSFIPHCFIEVCGMEEKKDSGMEEKKGSGMEEKSNIQEMTPAVIG